MKGKRFWMGIAVALVLALGALWAALQGGPLARGYAEAVFHWNRAAFEAAAGQSMEQGSSQGTACPLGVGQVKLCNNQETAVEFSMGAWGLGSSTRYWGIQYVPAGELLGYQGAVLEGWRPDGAGWRWEEAEGDNHCFVQELDWRWYYYEMYF